MNDKIITALLAILIALGGWTLSRTFSLSQDMVLIKEKVSQLEEKIDKGLKRKNKSLTEVMVLCLIIGLMLALVLLAGCSYQMVPHETKIEYGTVDTDAKNDKLQQKKSITQIWKWKQHD